MNKKLRTPQQQTIVDALVKRLNVDGGKTLFLNEEKPDEPWLRANMLTAIARQSGLFKSIEVKYDRFIEPLQQVVHQATVIDLEDRLYTFPGVATIADKMPPTQNAIADHYLPRS